MSEPLLSDTLAPVLISTDSFRQHLRGGRQDQIAAAMSLAIHQELRQRRGERTRGPLPSLNLFALSSLPNLAHVSLEFIWKQIVRGEQGTTSLGLSQPMSTVTFRKYSTAVSTLLSGRAGITELVNQR